MKISATGLIGVGLSASGQIGVELASTGLIGVTISQTGVIQPITAPAAPTNLVAVAISSSEIDLTWEDNATNETAYEVQRSLDGVSGWVTLDDSLPPDTTSYSDTGLTAETQYFYRVRAVRVDVVSDWSNVADATTQQAYMLLENFTASDGTPVAGKVPDITDNGAVWLASVSGYSAIGMSILSNRAVNPAASGTTTAGNRILLSSANRDIRFLFRTVAPGANGFNHAFPTIRGNATGTNRIVVRVVSRVTAGELQLAIVGGSTIATAAIPIWSAGQDITLRCVMDGPNYNIYWNGVLYITASNATHQTELYLGATLSAPFNPPFEFDKIEVLPV